VFVEMLTFGISSMSPDLGFPGNQPGPYIKFFILFNNPLIVEVLLSRYFE